MTHRVKYFEHFLQAWLAGSVDNILSVGYSSEVLNYQLVEAHSVLRSGLPGAKRFSSSRCGSGGHPVFPRAG